MKFLEFIFYCIFIILNTLKAEFSVNKNESIFVRITDKIDQKYFESFTQINDILNVSTRLKCIARCVKKNACNYINFDKNTCYLYESISLLPNILDGKFWINNQKIKSFEEITISIGSYSISQLTGSGYTKVYDQFYSNSTTLIQLNNIKSQCNISSILCAGGGLVNSDSIILMSCANCHAVLTETILNEPVFVGSAYWYMTPSKSFGFSPSSTINQNSADTHDTSNPYRLSWHVDRGGGWRLGNITDLNSNSNYKKYIFIK